ncbi:Txe/YoeB family addiction module toxin [Actinocorallia sp. API 0066]|uniref:Txe/YoeB family addiction module toxin n=1 Tax=Actinocorallia sp. API 0066 TaxID=2896846 RepID=UPI001E3D7F56|nr:Txe/YoeB family addiction module toxin [Actinocorallia sp. API 0066]MCD0451922.1 Txe/YoeB family addiction module toxin [Actinocorallia sp. API 0066]
MKILFTPEAWDDYLWWQRNDRATLRRLNRLIEDICRNGYEGIGKPEPLRQNLAGFWSRRITAEHRVVYAVQADTVQIIACRTHYE